MDIRKMKTRFIGEAQGHCCGMPYTVAGGSLVFWCGEQFNDDLLKEALKMAINELDICDAQASLGEPSGFWNNQDVGEVTEECQPCEPGDCCEVNAKQKLKAKSPGC